MSSTLKWSISGISYLNIIAISKGIIEELQKYPKDIFNDRKMKIAQAAYWLTIIALLVMMTVLLANPLEGKA